MNRTRGCRILTISGIAALSLAAYADARMQARESRAAQRESTGPQAPAPAGPAVNADARTLAAVQARIAEYVALHRKLEATLPRLPKETTPEAVDAHHRALARLLQQARSDARPGDIFTADARAVIRRLLARVVSAPGGAAVRASIMDDNPGALKLLINARYPDSVPLASMPPQVLQELPRLPEELEHRFLGDRLILMDVHAHIIVDLIEKALPR